MKALIGEGELLFGQGLWPYRSFWTLPIPTSKKKSVRKALGATHLCILGTRLINVAYYFWFGVAAANQMGDEDLIFHEKVAIHKIGKELVEHGTNTNTAYHLVHR